MPRKAVETRKRSNGTGSVWELETGRWRYEIVLGYKAGKRITKSGTAANKTEAQKAAAQALTDHARGSLAMPDRITFAEWLEKWLEGKKAKLSPNTTNRYAELIRLHINPHIGKVKVQAFKPVQLREFYAMHGQGPLAPRTVRHIHNIIHGSLETALRLELVMRNVADIVKPEIASQDNTLKVAQSWTADEATRFIAAARGDTHYAMFYLLLALGLRRGEVLGLRWTNVNLEKPSVRIEEAIVSIAGKMHVTTPKTMNSRRTLRLPADVVNVLKQHKIDQERTHLENGIRPARDYLFTSETGTPIDPNNVKRIMKRIVTVAGVRLIRIHDLRHTWASLARRAGIPLEVVSEKLGHARSSFTADVYRHTFEDEHEAAALNLIQLLDSRPRAAA
jgi:integrase